MFPSLFSLINRGRGWKIRTWRVFINYYIAHKGSINKHLKVLSLIANKSFCFKSKQALNRTDKKNNMYMYINYGNDLFSKSTILCKKYIFDSYLV